MLIPKRKLYKNLSIIDIRNTGLVFLLSFFIYSSSFASNPISDNLFFITSYGATGDGKVLETVAIQKAVDAAHAAGGGTVCFPAGKYLSGTIILKSNVNLYLERGAILLGSPDSTHYNEIWPKFRSYTDNYVSKALIYAESQNNIGITGYGTIDGQGENWQWRDYGTRPYVIRFVDCKHVDIENVHMRNSPMWMQHYLYCDFVNIRGINVWNHSTYNNDMIDIDCCRNVTVSDCWGDSDDDALTLKSTGPRPTENVTITNCVLSSRCNAIKMGTESTGGFKNISISNCTINSHHKGKGFYGYNLGSTGISLEIVDGGTLENITISNITIKGVRSPLFLRLGNRARPYTKTAEKPDVGTFSNVVISNIIATELDTFGCSILGTPGHPIENVTLSNIRMRFPGGGTKEDAEKALPEQEQGYPDASRFGRLPAWGFYCRHVQGLRMSGIDLECESDDQRPMLYYDDVRDLDLNGISGKITSPGHEAMVVLKEVLNVSFMGLRPPPETELYKCIGDCKGILKH
jgi:polygalacturonase